VVQDETPGAPFAGARARVGRSRVSAFSCFGCDQCRRAASGKDRVDVLGHVCVCGFVDQERQAARRRGYEGGELCGGRRIAEDGQLSGGKERRGLVEDKAEAGI